MTPLMYAVKDNRTGLLDRMIELGADVGARNNASISKKRLSTEPLTAINFSYPPFCTKHIRDSFVILIYKTLVLNFSSFFFFFLCRYRDRYRDSRLRKEKKVSKENHCDCFINKTRIALRGCNA